MAKYCSDCKNLNLKKEKPPGCYECKKQKKNMWACTPACDKYEFDWSRKSAKRQEIYNKATKEIHVDRHPMKASELIMFTLVAFVLFLISSCAR